MSKQFEGLPDIRTIQPDRLIKHRVSEDGFHAEVLLPGLWYTDFDKKIGGKLSYWAIAKLHESLRWVALMHGFSRYPTLCHGTNKSLFVASAFYELTQDFHKVVYKNSFGISYPLYARLWNSDMGRTSACTAIHLYDSTGTLLSKHAVSFVYVDKITRKPAPWPEFVKEAYLRSQYSMPKYNINRTAPPSISSNSFQLKTKVLHSDCDLNMHTTQATYLRWCSDVLAEAAKGGYFSFFKKHPELYPLKHTELHYVGEALANSEVIMNAWEDMKDPRCVYCTISCEGKIIFHSKLEYYDASPVAIEPHMESKL